MADMKNEVIHNKTVKNLKTGDLSNNNKHLGTITKVCGNNIKNSKSAGSIRTDVSANTRKHHR